jgi:ketosteroid isomerase-like protein
MSEMDRDIVAEEEAREPLSEREAAAMGSQRPRPLRDISEEAETIYGEVDGPETEDQYDAHHAEPGEHV